MMAFDAFDSDRVWYSRLKWWLNEGEEALSLQDALAPMLPYIQEKHGWKITDLQKNIDEVLCDMTNMVAELGVKFNVHHAGAIHVWTKEEPPWHNFITSALTDTENRYVNDSFSRELVASRKYIKLLSDSLEQLPPEYTLQGSVHRGVKWAYPSPATHDTKIHLPPRQRLYLSSFRSVSSDPQVPHEFNGNAGLRSYFKIEDAKGYHIQDFSATSNQSEIILPLFTQVEVTTTYTCAIVDASAVDNVESESHQGELDLVIMRWLSWDHDSLPPQDDNPERSRCFPAADLNPVGADPAGHLMMPRMRGDRASKGQSQQQKKQQQWQRQRQKKQQQSNSIYGTGKDEDSQLFEEAEATTRSFATVSNARRSLCQQWHMKQQSRCDPIGIASAICHAMPGGRSCCMSKRQVKQQGKSTCGTNKHQDPEFFEEEEHCTKSSVAANTDTSSLTMKKMGVAMKLVENNGLADGEKATALISSSVNHFTKLSASDGEVTHCESKPRMLEDYCQDDIEEGHTVAIFADYDGCFDLISPSNPAGAKMDKMFDYADQIGKLLHPRIYVQKLLEDFLKEITVGAARVVVFSGSNRQSRKADEFNSVQNENGLAMMGLEKLAEQKGWQFNDNLLEDAGINPGDIMNSVGGSSKIKQMLAEKNFDHLKGPATVYFFDDVEKYLKFIRKHATIPKNIELKTVLFDWYGICIDGTQEAPLIAIPAESR